MKAFFAVISMIILFANVSNACGPAQDGYLTKVSLTIDAKDDIKETVVKAFKSQLNAKCLSPIKTKYSQVEADMEGLGQLSAPTVDGMFLLSSGKSSAATHGITYLMGIPAFFSGTGLIEGYAYYVIVNVELHLADEENGVETLDIYFSKHIDTLTE